jgi:hypothetical protein
MSSVQGPTFTAQSAAARIRELEQQVDNYQARGLEVKIAKPEPFEGERGKLRGFLAQLDMYMDTQSNRLQTPKDKVLLAASFLKGKAAEWIEPYITAQYHPRSDSDGDMLDRDEELRKIFDDYTNFIDAIKTTFGQVDEKQAAGRKLRQLQQRGPASTYASEFQQIITKLTWDDEAYVEVFYNGLKEDVKDEIARMDERPSELSKMIEKAVRIDDRLWDRKQEKKSKERRADYWKNTKGQTNGKTKDRYKDPYGLQPMDIDTRQTGVSKDEQRKKNLCFYCNKPGHRARNCRKRAGDLKTKGEDKNIEVRVTEIARECEPATIGKEWCTNRKCELHFRKNSARDAAWVREDLEWELPVDRWDTSDVRHPQHDCMHWTACYDDNCDTHESGKREGYYPTAPKSYRDKKAALWAVWKTEQPKNKTGDIEAMSETETMPTILEEPTMVRETTGAKLRKQLQTKWWEKTPIHMTKPNTMITPRAPEVPEITGIQETRILKNREDKGKPEELEEVSTDEDEGWYDTLQQTTIQEVCKEGHWITCTKPDCQKHLERKNEAGWFPSEPWEYDSLWDSPTDSYEPIKTNTRIPQEVRQDDDNLEHDYDMPWIVCTKAECSIHYGQKQKNRWFPTEPGEFLEEGRYHWHENRDQDLEICYRPRCTEPYYEKMNTRQYKQISRACRKGFCPGQRGFLGYIALMKSGLQDAIDTLEEQSKN